MDPDQLRKIAEQLRKPSGEDGIRMAELMHESNFAMTETTLEMLNIGHGEDILELGHGNCAHLEHLFSKAEAIRYRGLDISELMQRTASSLHAKRVDEGSAVFSLYDGRKLPYPDGLFDKILTVNTVYFWDQPEAMMEEFNRVLKPQGSLCICFGQKEYMQKLPFTPFGFRLYDNQMMEALAASGGFEIKDSKTVNDHILSKTGEPVERIFTVLRLQKKPG